MHARALIHLRQPVVGTDPETLTSIATSRAESEEARGSCSFVQFFGILLQVYQFIRLQSDNVINSKDRRENVDKSSIAWRRMRR